LRRLPVGTVKTQMRAALQKLRGVLQEAPDEGSSTSRQRFGTPRHAI
jgi:hypothetical protein